MAAKGSQVACLISLIVFVSLSVADDNRGSDAVSYDNNAFQLAIDSKKHFVMFFAPWCGHCKQLAPTWNELAKVYNHEKSPITVAKVDCTVEMALCSEHDVFRYPTLKFFYKNANDFQRYEGNGDLDSLKEFVEEEASRERFHFIQFYAPRCKNCEELDPVWEELVESFAGSKDVSLSKVDCTLSPKLCTDQGVKDYPKLILFRNDDEVERYNYGNVWSHEDLLRFVNKHVREERKCFADGPLVELTDATFKNVIQEGFHFIQFYAPWCGHCKQLAPTWEKLAGSFARSKHVSISKVDCTLSTKLCTDQGVKSYPTLILFKNGDKVEQYQGSQSHEDLKNFVNKNVREEGKCYADEPPVDLTDATFKNVIQEGFHFIQFYAPWCGHCKQLAPTWEKLVGSFAGSKDVSLSKVEEYQGRLRYEDLKNFVKKNVRGKVEQNQGSQSSEDLKNFVNKNVGAEDAVVDLTDETFEEATAAGRTFVNFFAPWCGHCKHLAPIWTKLGQANEGKDVTIARVDCTRYKALCDTESVEGYPTLLMYHNGQRKEFQGQKDQDSLRDFVDNFQKHTEL